MGHILIAEDNTKVSNSRIQNGYSMSIIEVIIRIIHQMDKTTITTTKTAVQIIHLAPVTLSKVK